ncbi:hypothetical protein [Herbihabitans rhizosphaerae]|nr:hypothetical protein [Herbihabitans rhizosphaerae]
MTEDIRVPITPGDTMDDVMRRFVGAPAGVAVPIVPGWDWHLVLDGLAGARHRYLQALGTENGMAARRAVGEALWWVSAADEYLRERISGMKNSDYYRELVKTVGGARLAGLVYARNRAGHQLARLLLLRLTHVEPITVVATDGSQRQVHTQVQVHYGLRPFDPAPQDGYYFADNNNLPSASAAHRERFDRNTCYINHVALQPVNDILEKTETALRKTLQWNQTGPDRYNIAINTTISPLT